MHIWVYVVAVRLPTWAVMRALGWVNKGSFATGGSAAKTSAPKPAISLLSNFCKNLAQHGFNGFLHRFHQFRCVQNIVYPKS
jgi:hypothetical protein